jgi:hypothetical protein
LVHACTSVPCLIVPLFPCLPSQGVAKHTITLLAVYIVLLPILGRLMYCGLLSRHLLFLFSMFCCMIFGFQRLISCCYYFTFSFCFQISPRWS